MYVLTGNTAEYFEGDQLKISEQLSPGVWGIGYKPITNAPYLYKMDSYKTFHGKIYGHAQENADHVIKAYEMEKTKNLGVLFSGKKGLGKSLTIRLIVEQLVKTHPVVIVDRFTTVIPSVLSDLHDAVIVLDEFEKMSRKTEKEDGMTPQESLLSTLDGTKSLTHNLYLLSVNNVCSLNDNLISRPGRIRYHYRYDNINKKIVEQYCEDNLIESRWGDIQSVFDAISSSDVRSLDILQALVAEMNVFPEASVADIMKYMNIGELQCAVDFKFVITVDGHPININDTWRNVGRNPYGWVIDDALYIRFHFEYPPMVETYLSSTQYKIDSWGYAYIGDFIDTTDPFWDQFKDRDGDYYIDFNEVIRSHKHNVVVTSVSVQKHFDWETV